MNKMCFSLSKAAEEHLKAVLPGFVEEMSKEKLVPMLSYSGSGKCEKDGKVTWEYAGPLFLLAGQKREKLRDGEDYDILVFQFGYGTLTSFS